MIKRPPIPKTKATQSLRNVAIFQKSIPNVDPTLKRWLQPSLMSVCTFSFEDSNSFKNHLATIPPLATSFQHTGNWTQKGVQKRHLLIYYIVGRMDKKNWFQPVLQPYLGSRIRVLFSIENCEFENCGM